MTDEKEELQFHQPHKPVFQFYMKFDDHYQPVFFAQ